MWAKKDKRKLLLRGSIADIVGYHQYPLELTILRCSVCSSSQHEHLFAQGEGLGELTPLQQLSIIH